MARTPEFGQGGPTSDQPDRPFPLPVSGAVGAERSKLQETFDGLVAAVTGGNPYERFSEASCLRVWLSDYLGEYPFLATDAEILLHLRDLLGTPLEIPRAIYALGVFDVDADWASEERDRQIRTVLERASIRRSQGGTQGVE